MNSARSRSCSRLDMLNYNFTTHGQPSQGKSLRIQLILKDQLRTVTSP